jgi:hypothetical protein
VCTLGKPGFLPNFFFLSVVITRWVTTGWLMGTTGSLALTAAVTCCRHYSL